MEQKSFADGIEVMGELMKQSVNMPLLLILVNRDLRLLILKQARSVILHLLIISVQPGLRMVNISHIRIRTKIYVLLLQREAK